MVSGLKKCAWRNLSGILPIAFKRVSPNPEPIVVRRMIDDRLNRGVFCRQEQDVAVEKSGLSRLNHLIDANLLIFSRNSSPLTAYVVMPLQLVRPP